MKIKVLSAPEVAFLLRNELGPGRNWDDTLADMRRHRVKVHGCILKPTCMGKYAGAWRPMYAAPDVLDFIKAVRAADPAAARKVPYQVKTALIDPADLRHWKLRKLPVAGSTFIVHGAVTSSARASML